MKTLILLGTLLTSTVLLATPMPTLTGTVLDQTTQTPLEFATVSAFARADSSFVEGTTTKLLSARANTGS